MRKLASIQKIKEITPIIGADNIELAQILGWKVIVKKNEFKVDDLCIYFEIDSVLPDREWSAFLKSKTIKTMKLNKFGGIISQGLALSMNIFPELKNIYNCGDDVSIILGVTKNVTDFEPKEINITSKFSKMYGKLLGKYFHINLRKKYKGFPKYISKTDEERIQNIPQVLENWDNTKLYYSAEKIDGQSATYILEPHFLKDEFIVCSRNNRLNQDNSNWWQIAEKYEMKKKLKLAKKIYGEHFAIQGEIIGKGVQDNKYEIKGKEFYVFNVINITQKRKMNLDEMIIFCERVGLEMVPIIDKLFWGSDMNIDKIVQYAEGYSALCPSTLREGVIIRDRNDINFSFKVINPDFLIKYNL